jgi:hypothetical protein
VAGTLSIFNRGDVSSGGDITLWNADYTSGGSVKVSLQVPQSLAKQIFSGTGLSAPRSGRRCSWTADSPLPREVSRRPGGSGGRPRTGAVRRQREGRSERGRSARLRTRTSSRPSNRRRRSGERR